MPSHPQARTVDDSRLGLSEPSTIGRVNVRVIFEWGMVGQVDLDERQKLRFPKLPQTPGIYRFEIADAPDRVRWYLGETDNLRRRATHYRNPGPSQSTNIRLSAMIVSLLNKGGDCTMSVSTNVRADIGDGFKELDLARKSNRVLAEHAALLVAHELGIAAIENRSH